MTRGYKRVPNISFQGDWLKQYGFDAGTLISFICEDLVLLQRFLAKSRAVLLKGAAYIQTGAVFEIRLVVRTLSAACRGLITVLLHKFLVMTEAFLGLTHGNHLLSYVFPEAICPGPCNSRR